MVTATIRNASTGQILGDLPFVELPLRGESLVLKGGLPWLVTAVMHAWDASGQPRIGVDITPPAPPPVHA